MAAILLSYFQTSIFESWGGTLESQVFGKACLMFCLHKTLPLLGSYNYPSCSIQNTLCLNTINECPNVLCRKFLLRTRTIFHLALFLSFFQQELYSYCNRPRRTTLEVLQDFPAVSSRIPFHYLFDLIPAIQPRAFSIASSLKVSHRYVYLVSWV